MNTAEKTGHIGRKISKIRELRGMKQEALAFAIGVSQQTISNIENSETIDDDKLQEIAKALGVSQEAIKNFSEENVINYFNFYDNSSSQGNNIGAFGVTNCTFNPLEKVIELYDEKEKLFERLLQAEKDKVAYLERLMSK
jgi:transcriptional regulator with XRE-family HTH domain